MSCVMVEDFVKPYTNLSENKYLWISKGKRHHSHTKKTDNSFVRTNYDYSIFIYPSFLSFEISTY